MQIHSSRQSLSPAQKQTVQAREAYKQSLDHFNDIAPAADDRYQRRSSLVTNLTPLPAAVALIGGTAAVWSYGEPILDKIVESVHPAVAIPIALVGMFGPMAGGIYGTIKATEYLHNKLTHNPELDAATTELSGVRESYRSELLEKANDEGVTAISNPRWETLKNADESYYYVGGPVGKQASLNEHVNDLEWLLDMRQQNDWRGEIAREQDDPQVARRMIREAADRP